MPIALDFAMRVQRLQRQGLPPDRIAARLRTTVEHVMEAHRMLLLPVNDTAELVKHRTVAEREAELERMPLRMRKRIEDAGARRSTKRNGTRLTSA